MKTVIKGDSNLPEDLGKQAALQLVDEILYSGCIDTTFQSFVLFLMAISEKVPSVVKLGRITEYTIENLRLIKVFTNVVFKIQELESKVDDKSESDGENENSEDSDEMEEENKEKVGGNKEFMQPKCV